MIAYILRRKIRNNFSHTQVFGQKSEKYFFFVAILSKTAQNVKKKAHRFAATRLSIYLL